MRPLPVTRRVALCVLAVAALQPWCAAAQPASYPQRPLRFIIPQSPGGGSDTVGRLVAQRLAEEFSQSVIVDNRPGAAGMLGAEIVRQAQPDGYTLLLSAIDTVTAPLAARKPPFDPVRDFTPITLLTQSPNVWVVNPGFGAKSMKDLVETAKAKPDAIDYASSGVGGMQHLGGEMLNQLAGIRLSHVPYKGGGPAVLDTLAGRVMVMISGMPGAMPHIRSGKLRALAVTGPKRIAALPDVPTVAEALGLPAYNVMNWQGLFAPARTPAAIVDRVAAAAAMGLEHAEVRARLAEVGFDPVGMPPKPFAALVAEEQRKWSKIIRAAGIVAD